MSFKKALFLSVLGVTLVAQASNDLSVTGLRCRNESHTDPYHNDGSIQVFSLTQSAQNTLDLRGSSFIIPKDGGENETVVANALLLTGVTCTASPQNPKLVDCVKRDNIYNPLARVHLKEARINGVDVHELALESSELVKLTTQTKRSLGLDQAGEGRYSVNFSLGDCAITYSNP